MAEEALKNSFVQQSPTQLKYAITELIALNLKPNNNLLRLKALRGCLYQTYLILPTVIKVRMAVISAT